MEGFIVDVLPTIFAKLMGEIQTLCIMPLVSKLWYNAYRNIAYKIIRVNFDRYLSVVNVPIEKFEDLWAMQYYFVRVNGKLGQIQDDQDDPIDFDCTYDENEDEQLINWEYPLKVELPVDALEEIISCPEMFSACFTHNAFPPHGNCMPEHMCWLSLDGQQNYFINPQEWFPIYQPMQSYVTIGVNVRTGQFGIYYNAEENGHNFIIPKETAYGIIRNAYTMKQIGEKLRDLGSDGIIVDWITWDW